MWPYIVLYLAPITIAFIEKVNRTKEKTKYIFFSFFLIWLFLLLFRSTQIGIDLDNYEILFRSAYQISWKEVLSLAFFWDKDPGFYIISKILQLFSGDFRLLICVFAFASVIPLWLLFNKEIKAHAVLSLTIFLNIGLFSFYFSGLRQIVAISFGFLSYYYVKKRKFSPFLAAVFVAILFHKSAFILLFMYPIYHMRVLKKWTLFLGIPLIVAVYLFRTPIFLFLGSFIKDFYNIEVSNTSALSMFVLLVLFLLFSCFILDPSAIDEEAISLRNILVMVCVIQIFAGIHPIAMRMNYYFLPFIPILITRVVDCSKQQYKPLVKISMVVMICYFSFSFFNSAFNGKDVLNVFPYEFMWE